jgi:hypothetical protein
MLCKQVACESPCLSILLLDNPRNPGVFWCLNEALVVLLALDLCYVGLFGLGLV